jgi:hypothetical protein
MTEQTVQDEDDSDGMLHFPDSRRRGHDGTHRSLEMSMGGSVEDHVEQPVKLTIGPDADLSSDLELLGGPRNLQFCSGSPVRTMFTITAQGDVVLGEEIDWTDAAETFWREVDRLRPTDPT